MKNRIKHIATSLVMVLGLAFVALPSSVGAIDVFSGADCGGGGQQGAGQTAGQGAAANNANGGGSSALCDAVADDKAPDIVKNIINTMLYILGIIAVVMIVIGGIRYTTSNGDSSQVKAAKDTILYAVIGLIVAIMAFAIVNFIVGRISA